MRQSITIIMLLAFLLSTSSLQAASATPTITKRYKNVPMTEVLRGLEKKTHYTIVYNPNEVDDQRLITATFKDARLTTVVRKLFGKNYDIKLKKKIITVSLKPVPEVVSTASAAVVDVPVSAALDTMPVITLVGEDTVVATKSLDYHIYYDTLMTVVAHTEQRPAATQPEPLFAHCSHSAIVGLGLGYGEVSKHGHVAGQADASYAFFWNEHWGVSIGLGIDYYHSLYRYDRAYRVAQYTDSDTEPEGELQVQETNMRAHLHQLVLSVPLMLQMEYPIAPTSSLKLYASLGARIGYPVLHQSVLLGEITQKGYYSKWDLTLEQMHEFGTRKIDERWNYAIQAPSLAPQGELGVMIGRWAVGAYANVQVINQENYLPWQVGVKAAYRWRVPVRTKPLPVVYESYVVNDTTYTIREHIDTLHLVHYDTIPAAKKIVEVMETSIIWFDLNDITPKVDPIDMLDKIAAILVANPEQEVYVNGHTCDLGKKAYNEKLSRQRAQAVADLLIEKGAQPGQLHIQAFANSQPFYSKSHDRVLDRRVEIVPIGQ